MKSLKLVTRVMLADTETAVSVYLKLCDRRPDSFLLESAESHDVIGRFSLIGFDPLLSIELWPDRLEIANGQGRSTHPMEQFFSKIREISSSLPELADVGLTGVGALVGFIGYDAVRLIERLGPARTKGAPIARLMLPARVVIFDHLRRTMTLTALADDEATGRDKLSEMAALIEGPLRRRVDGGKLEITGPNHNHYVDAVSKAKEYIRAGDAFQIVLADRFEGRTEVAPIEVYRRLRVKSPSPYMFFLDFGAHQIVGASPETLVKVRDRRVMVRPIAGTRGRSSDPERDRALEEELRNSEKECAEHVMLVDLGRNDAGRVSRFGSVNVSPYMTVERYSHVMHLVSQVQGELAPDKDAVDAFMAGFPAGTVSGAPKVRAMQIIDELERLPRGPYAGAVGHFGPSGDMDTCIAIRMLHFQGDRFTVPVGAGIVADSEPEMEFQEIEHKAGQSLAALKAAAEGGL